jgi:pyruvate formate lyase activating enzyme
MMTGRIFDIQRFSIHDGPGIRTTVFLKGCPLKCKWCHNPEGIHPKPQLSFVPEKCIACGECMKACPEKALAKNAKGRAVIDRGSCTNCGDCPRVCDPKALEMVGRDASVEEVLEVVLRDKEYYEASGGGMTLSGGEPMYQPEYAGALLEAAKARSLHTVIETSGFAEWKAFEMVMPHTDLFLYDYKETDRHLHEAFSGVSNEVIRANILALDRAGAKILMRCPMIPEFNARKEHLDGIAAMAKELRNLQGVELLPYHRLGKAKMTRFGFLWRMPEGLAPPERATIDSWNAYLRGRGVRVI